MKGLSLCEAELVIPAVAKENFHIGINGRFPSEAGSGLDGVRFPRFCGAGFALTGDTDLDVL